MNLDGRICQRVSQSINTNAYGNVRVTARAKCQLYSTSRYPWNITSDM